MSSSPPEAHTSAQNSMIPAFALVSGFCAPALVDDPLEVCFPRALPRRLRQADVIDISFGQGVDGSSSARGFAVSAAAIEVSG